MQQYFPKDTAPVRAIRVPDPSDRGAYADFTSEVIRAGWADEVRVMKPRSATEKSKASEGGIYIPLNGTRGRTVQPGTWLVEQTSDPLTVLFLTEQDMGTKYQIGQPALPLEDGPTVVDMNANLAADDRSRDAVTDANEEADMAAPTGKARKG